MELLKQSDFVIIYDSTHDDIMRGIVITDEYEGSQVYVAVVRDNMMNTNYIDRKYITKIL